MVGGAGGHGGGGGVYVLGQGLYHRVEVSERGEAGGRVPVVGYSVGKVHHRNKEFGKQ